jgi:hypothetical protein
MSRDDPRQDRIDGGEMHRRGDVWVGRHKHTPISGQ